MATTFSSYLAAPIPQHACEFDSSEPTLPTKRPLSELYYGSYGESEATPTPKLRKTPRPSSRPGFISDQSSPTFYSTIPSAQVPRDFSMEVSEGESDDVYDEFDLGDFTKDEIKAYESMVGPGERLRDAGSPDKSWAEMLEASYQADLVPLDRKRPEGTAPVGTLPEELYELVRAGVSNAIDHALSRSSITYHCQSVDVLEDLLMDVISEPTPQISHLIRTHKFNFCTGQSLGSRKCALRDSGLPHDSIKSAQRQYEQDVYDLSRNLGLPIDCAEKWVLKAREFLSENDEYDSMDNEKNIAFESCDEIHCPHIRASSPQTFIMPSVPAQHSDQAPDDVASGNFHTNLSPDAENISVSSISQAPTFAGESTCKSQDESNNDIEDMLQLMAKNGLTGAKLLQQCKFQELADADGHAEQGKILPAVFRAPVLGDESFVENVIGQDGEIDMTEAVVKRSEEKAVKKTFKNARKVERKAEKEAARQAEKNKRRKGNDEREENFERQMRMTSNSEQLEDNIKPRPEKKKGKKRKRDKELLPESEFQFEESHKRKKGRAASDVQGVDSSRTKSRKKGPEQSPFFQRSSGSKAQKKDAATKAEQKLDFQAPMIRPPPGYSPSTPFRKKIGMASNPPASDDSSPLSSLRSTPSLPSFGNKEIERENQRIRQLSYNTSPKVIASTSKVLNDPTDLPIPASNPISLLELNKRLLEGTIYQDGIDLPKPEAPAALSVSKKARKRSVTVSRFFAQTKSKKSKASEKVSCIPFPPLHSTSFGLVQERLSHDPFRLLIAVIFLNKTRGSVALPVFYQLMERYPTPAELAAAKQEDIVEIIQHLGLQNQRAKKCINLAKAWLERPPEKGKRYRVLHYPKRDDGKDVRSDDIIGEEDERVAWEIGQLPGIGVYAIDSWRIFCRDQLRGLPNGLPKGLTPEAKEEDLQKEWTRVLAGDKELRAYLRWRWLRNGWDWDPVTGERKKADEEELAKADRGGVIYEGDGGDIVVANGNLIGEVRDAVKAEFKVKEKDARKGNGDADEVTADTKVDCALEKDGEQAEAITTEPQHSDDRAEEQKDGNATKDDPER